MPGTHTPEYQRAWYAAHPEAREKAQIRARNGRLLRRLARAPTMCISCGKDRTLKYKLDNNDFRSYDNRHGIGRNCYEFLCPSCYLPLSASLNRGSGRWLIENNPEFRLECVLLIILVNETKLSLSSILISAGVYSGRTR